MTANVQEIGAGVAIFVFIFNAAFQYGLFFAAKQRHDDELKRLEKQVEACRSEWKAETSSLDDRFGAIEKTLQNIDRVVTRLDERMKNKL